MVGLLIALFVSWLLLWFIDKSFLEKLGLIPRRRRVIYFLMGLAISILCCGVYFGSFIFFSGSGLSINNNFNLITFFKSLWWVIRSVLFEEFLFRGTLLYLAIKYIGPKTACALSAIAFGIYHWFSYGILGNPEQMLFVFVLTATAGLIFAYAFVRTKSMYLQTGLHLGWNFVLIIVFSQGPLGNQLLITSGGQQVGIALSIILFLLQLLSLPVLTIYYLNGRLSLQPKKEKKER